jgi:hypothetical protein
MMLVVDRDRRWRNAKLKAVSLPWAASKILIFFFHVPQLLVEPIDLHQQLLLLVMATAVTASPTFKIWQDRNKKARDEKPKGKSQNKRYDPFEKSGVQHKNLTCLNNLPHYLRRASQFGFTYRRVFNLNSFVGRRKAF